MLKIHSSFLTVHSFSKDSYRDTLQPATPLKCIPGRKQAFPESVTNMTLKSAMQDVQDRTLRAVTGVLAKLQYLVSLRNQDGAYSHWGLERVHGEAATQNALQDAHRGVVSSILRTQLRNLFRDLQETSGSENEATELLDQLQSSPKIVPPKPGAGTERHLNSVLHALARLVKNQR